MRVLLMIGLMSGVAAAEGVEPRVLHRPINSARPDVAMAIRAEVQGDGALADLILVVHDAEGAVRELPFERSGPRQYAATIPKAMTAGTALAYAIESRDRAGTVRQHFASRAEPHLVDLHGDGETAQLRRQLARYDGRRNRFRLRGELVAFGGRRAGDAATDDYSDAWYAADAEYVFRTLRLVHDIRFRAGVMRGRFPEVDGSAVERGKAPGLNFGSAEATFELHRWFSVAGRFLLSINEEGFGVGAGTVVRIGDIAGTHLAGDYEFIDEVGTRLDLRLHWSTVPRFPMALGVTFTDWPDERDDRMSTLLSYDLGWQVSDRTQVGLRLGAANRPESLSTGFTTGLSMAQSF